MDEKLIIFKEEEYKAYIDKHIRLVKEAFEKYFSDGVIIRKYYHIPPSAERILQSLKENIEHHDESKYSDEEFDAYRRYYFPINEEEKNNAEEDYKKALEHHYANNNHHPEYWSSNNDTESQVRYMNPVSLLEMCCDLIAVSMDKGGSPVDYWKEHKGDKPMKHEDREHMTGLFKAIEHEYGELRF